MPVKIRLQRRGRKKRPFYHIVAADARAPRDGKFIEKLGVYNPMTKPATIELDREKAYEWLTKGAQPTDTVRAILRFKGVMYRKHLMRGVDKGALTQEAADQKWQAWIDNKEAGLAERKEAADAEIAGLHVTRFGDIPVIVAPVVEEQAPVGQDIDETLAAAAERKATEEAPAVEEVKEEAPAPVAEEVKEEAPAPVAEEVKEEAPAPVVEEVKEEAPAPAVEAAPVAEAPKEEAKPDKLTKIEGIGPKISETIQAGGIKTFAQLAEATPESIKEILDNAEGNFAAHNPSTWPAQAKMAAAGEWDKLKTWQDELDGGKEVK